MYPVQSDQLQSFCDSAMPVRPNRSIKTYQTFPRKAQQSFPPIQPPSGDFQQNKTKEQRKGKERKGKKVKRLFQPYNSPSESLSLEESFSAAIMARSISRLARIWFDREGAATVAVGAGAAEVESVVEAVVVAWTAEMGITVAGVAGVAWPVAGVAAAATKAAYPPSCVGKTGLRTRDPLGLIMESRA